MLSPKIKPIINVVILLFLIGLHQTSGQYQPTWESLDSRPIPDWYDQAKIGIMVHWGVYSVPSFGSEWFWERWQTEKQSNYVEFMENNYPHYTYQDFAKDFTAELYDPNLWADLFNKAGFRYVILTAKHLEGYAMWPSKYSFAWNVYDVGPHRDLVGELAEAVKNEGLRFGLYYTLMEWFHPLYLTDKNTDWQTTNFVEQKVLPEMRDLVTSYQPDIFWTEGTWEAEDTYWKSTEFLAWLYNESPVRQVVVTNDQWGASTTCTHGGFYTCPDHYNPGTLKPHKWENPITIDEQSWGYRREALLEQFLTTYELIVTLVQTVARGGNLLVNIGATRDGTIVPFFQERLLQLGNWLKVNGEAIYESQIWTVQNDTITSGVWYTERNGAVYATVLNWPEANTLTLSPVELFQATTNVRLLGYEDEDISWQLDANHVVLRFPDKAKVTTKWAWVLKITTTPK